MGLVDVGRSGRWPIRSGHMWMGVGSAGLEIMLRNYRAGCRDAPDDRGEETRSVVRTRAHRSSFGQ
jgi:hypothetical protein